MRAEQASKGRNEVELWQVFNIPEQGEMNQFFKDFRRIDMHTRLLAGEIELLS